MATLEPLSISAVGDTWTSRGRGLTELHTHTHTQLSAPKTKESAKEGGLHLCQCLGCGITLSFCKMLSLEETGQNVKGTPTFL